MAKKIVPPGIEVVAGELIEASTKIVPVAPLGDTSRTDYSGAANDEHFVTIWLDGLRTSPHTVRSYTRASSRFLSFLMTRGSTLRMAKVADLLAWQTALAADDERRRPTPPGEKYLMSAHTRQQLAAVKSLLAKGRVTGYLPFDVGAAVKLPPVRDVLAERLLTIEEVDAIFAATTPDEEPVVRLLYYLGCRVAELVQLRWQHVMRTPDGGVTVTVHGKGEKTRYVHLDPSEAKSLLLLQPAEVGDDVGERYVFPSRRGGKHMHASSAWRLVHAAVVRSGIGRRASPHWFRHAHASHALDAGAPPHLVQQTLGHASLTTTTRYAHVRPGESSSKYLKR